MLFCTDDARLGKMPGKSSSSLSDQGTKQPAVSVSEPLLDTFPLLCFLLLLRNLGVLYSIHLPVLSSCEASPLFLKNWVQLDIHSSNSWSFYWALSSVLYFRGWTWQMPSPSFRRKPGSREALTLLLFPSPRTLSLSLDIYPASPLHFLQPSFTGQLQPIMRQLSQLSFGVTLWHWFFSFGQACGGSLATNPTYQQRRATALDELFL